MAALTLGLAALKLADARPGYDTFSSSNSDNEREPPKPSHDGDSADPDDTVLSDAPVEVFDIRRQLVLSEICAIGGLTIWLVLIAIVRRASRFYLGPMLLGRLLFGMFVPDKEPEDARMLHLRLYKNGRGLSRYQKHYWKNAAIANAVMVFFGFLGMLVIGPSAWGSWIPDLDSEDLSPLKFVWCWFLILALFGLMFLLVSAFLFPLYNKPPKPATKAPEPVVSPDLPPPFNDCVLSYTVFDISCAGLFVRPSDNGTAFGISLAVWLLSMGWIFYKILKQVNKESMIQLCIDWATHIDHVSADPQIVELLAQREKIRKKYAWSLLAGVLPLLGCMIFFLASDNGGFKNFAIFASLSLVYSYYCLWAIWRRRRE